MEGTAIRITNYKLQITNFKLKKGISLISKAFKGSTLIRTRLRRNLVNDKGISLIEILVTILIFAIMGILISRIILITLQGAGKSSSLVKVRDNLDYSISIIEREIRNAQTITCPSSTQVNYTNSLGAPGSFSCQGTQVASGSSMLTSTDVSITSCSFTCTDAVGHVPPSVTISLVAKDALTSGPNSSQATINTQIYLRTY